MNDAMSDATMAPNGARDDGADATRRIASPMMRRVANWNVARLVALPILLYTAAYFVLTYPLVLAFRSEYFCDKGDGYQTIWTLWWIRRAVVDLHVSPWQTSYLFYPYGVSLLLHSLTPFDGFVYIPLSAVFSPVVAYNLIIVGTFVFSGLTTFWLALYLTGRYWPSMVAGYVLAFSAIRFGHAPGHLHQLSTYFLPVFALAWIHLFRRPSAALAVTAGIALFLNLLCDHYLFFYCCLFAAIWMVPALVRATYSLLRTRGENGRGAASSSPQADEPLSPPLPAYGERSRRLIAAIVFLITAAITCGPLIIAMMRNAKSSGGLQNVHDPSVFASDLLGPFLPSWAWIYHEWTRPIWQPVGAVNETTVSIGIATIVMAIAGAWRMRSERTMGAGRWSAVALIFLILSFGPKLNLLGAPIDRFGTGFKLFDHMPYAWLEAVIPPMRYSGVPARMMIVTQLAAAVLVAIGLSSLSNLKPGNRKLLTLLFMFGLIVESLPRVQISTPPDRPGWAVALRKDPSKDGVLDAIDEGNEISMVHQTIHEHPIASGYLSRVATSLSEQSKSQFELARQNRFDELTAMGFGFIVAGRQSDADFASLPIWYEDRQARIYKLDRASP